eukprot:TRINITY_DN18815_c0_g1_i1.p1 TRINITY_DN18815_c0_g1~~TRINITY_DN18815_c0_g1_i1.p1  ORF type:complete len:352 (-),score=86.69 TRINITY_DN18815_c0_g1_i1:238-1293(-)
MDDDFRAKRKARARAAPAIEKRFVELGKKCLTQLKLSADQLHQAPTWTAEDVDRYVDSELPCYADPNEYMNPARARRKRQQLGNMILALEGLVRAGVIGRDCVVADLCSGSGHLGFAIAAHFPDMTVILVELNSTAVEKARDRVQLMPEDQRHRVRVVHQSVLEFDDEFDVVVALHACGMLSDIAHFHALSRSAAYVLCPCCVGKVQLMHDKFAKTLGDSKLDKMKAAYENLFPRSYNLSQILNSKEFYELARHADYSEWDEKTIGKEGCDDDDDDDDDEKEAKSLAAVKPEEAKQRRLCKTIVEMDRNWSASGYSTSLVKMIPVTCTPKNEILIGYLLPHAAPAIEIDVK